MTDGKIEEMAGGKTDIMKRGFFVIVERGA
jgi:hypothetical protein